MFKGEKKQEEPMPVILLLLMDGCLFDFCIMTVEKNKNKIPLSNSPKTWASSHPSFLYFCSRDTDIPSPKLPAFTSYSFLPGKLPNITKSNFLESSGLSCACVSEGTQEQLPLNLLTLHSSNHLWFITQYLLTPLISAGALSNPFPAI